MMDVERRNPVRTNLCGPLDNCKVPGWIPDRAARQPTHASHGSIMKGRLGDGIAAGEAPLRRCGAWWCG